MFLTLPKTRPDPAQYFFNSFMPKESTKTRPGFRPGRKIDYNTARVKFFFKIKKIFLTQKYVKKNLTWAGFQYFFAARAKVRAGFFYKKKLKNIGSGPCFGQSPCFEIICGVQDKCKNFKVKLLRKISQFLFKNLFRLKKYYRKAFNKKRETYAKASVFDYF